MPGGSPTACVGWTAATWPGPLRPRGSAVVRHCARESLHWKRPCAEAGEDRFGPAERRKKQGTRVCARTSWVKSNALNHDITKSYMLTVEGADNLEIITASDIQRIEGSCGKSAMSATRYVHTRSWMPMPFKVIFICHRISSKLGDGELQEPTDEVVRRPRRTCEPNIRNLDGRFITPNESGDHVGWEMESHAPCRAPSSRPLAAGARCKHRQSFQCIVDTRRIRATEGYWHCGEASLQWS